MWLSVHKKGTKGLMWIHKVKCIDAKVLTSSMSNKDKHEIILYKDPKD